MRSVIYSLLVAAVLAVGNSSPIIGQNDIKQLHNEWMIKHGKTYRSPAEENHRFGIFMENMEYILEHNMEFSMGKSSFSVGMNAHMDMTFEEFKSLRLSYAPSNVTHRPEAGHSGVHYAPLIRGVLPESIDWRAKGAVSEVKNQGECGSCWSFSTTGSIEGAHFIATGELVSLSEEQLINCINDGEFDCKNGGDMVAAYQYVIDNGGLVSESTWPYESQDHATCRYGRNSNKNVATISSYKTIPMNDEAALMSALAHGPVAVAIDASQKSFQFYNGGVYDEPDCCHDCRLEDLDHGVLAVGYGKENGKDYWLIKNSWSSQWGEDGYVKIVRNKRGACGVATSAAYPVV